MTDSLGSHSDISATTMQSNSTMIKPQIKIVCILDICQSDNLIQRKKALEEVKLACFQIGATLNHIQVSGIHIVLSSCKIYFLYW